MATPRFQPRPTSQFTAGSSANDRNSDEHHPHDQVAQPPEQRERRVRGEEREHDQQQHPRDPRRHPLGLGVGPPADLLRSPGLRLRERGRVLGEQRPGPSPAAYRPRPRPAPASRRAYHGHMPQEARGKTGKPTRDPEQADAAARPSRPSAALGRGEHARARGLRRAHARGEPPPRPRAPERRPVLPGARGLGDRLEAGARHRRTPSSSRGCPSSAPGTRTCSAATPTAPSGCCGGAPGGSAATRSGTGASTRARRRRARPRLWPRRSSGARSCPARTPAFEPPVV